MPDATTPTDLDFDEQMCQVLKGDLDVYLSRCQNINSPPDEGDDDLRKYAGLRIVSGHSVFEVVQLSPADLRRLASFLNNYAQRLKDFPE